MDDYQVLRRDREKDNTKGGVFILAKNDVTITREEELETECELLWCRVEIQGSKNLHIGAYYRPHERDEESLNQLEASLNRLGDTNDNIILGGDFNFPGMNWIQGEIKDDCRTPTLHNKFQDMLHDHGLAQIVEDTTRDRNTLDLICTNLPGKINKTEVIPGISDHCIPTAEVDVRPIKRQQKPRRIHLYKKAEWTKMAEELGNVQEQIEQQQHSKTTNELWLMFKDAITKAAQKYIPSKICKKRDRLPYITPEIVKLIKRRDRVYKKRQRAKRNFNHSATGYQNADKKLKQLKKEIQTKLRQAYWSYIESIITPVENDSGTASGMKRFWQFVKSKRKERVGVATLKVDGKSVSNPRDKANELNKQFESVFTREGPLSNDLLPDQSPHPTMSDIDITEPGVRKMLEKLNVHKAQGPDEIGPQILKNLASTIAPILTVIYRRSYETGRIPEDWRMANVVPAYKKGKNSLPSNYRPISLTCIACKMMEHIVTSSIMKHANNHGILYSLQHGFRDRRSCETQLIEFQADILQNMKNGMQTDVLIMDFSKAFDKVGHMHLMEKLKYYGIQGRTNAWIKDFLADRKQVVVVDGEKSYEANVMSGVPQGSVLGPSLFLYYINDIAESMNSSVRLFADDTIAYLAITSLEDAEALQEDLSKLGRWEQKWHMEFHPEKCQVLTITRKRTPIVYDYKLHGHTLEHVDSAKYLGVTMTKDFRWNTHINNITMKANNTLSFLRRNVQVNCPRIKTAAYQTLVRPLLEYAPTVWDPHTQANIKKMEMVQRRAARYTLHRYHNTSSVTAMLDHLNWTTLEQRRQQQRLSMYFKIHHQIVAVDKNKYLTPLNRTSRHTHKEAYQIPDSSKNYLANSFFCRTTREWNALPAQTVEAPSVESFQARLARGAPQRKSV